MTSAHAATVSGRIRYEDRPLTRTGFGTSQFLPVRFAQVAVVNATTTAVLASTHTDASGNYSVQVPSQGSVSIQLRVEARNTLATDRIDVQVLSDTTSRTLLTAAGPAATRDTNNALTIDLDVPTTGGGGGAFNIFDNAVKAQEFINRFSTRTPPRLTLFWQPVADGPGSDDGTFFTSDNAVHLLNRATANANVPLPNADEYDDTVILHECGHYFFANYSVDNSLGGVHFIDADHSDIRLAWSEGAATWFGQTIANTAFQVNSFVTRVGSFEIETPSFASTTTGFDTEQSVSAIMWDVSDVNDTPDHPTTGVDDDPIRLTDGVNRIMQVLVNDYRTTDDTIWEDFYNKFRTRHGDSFIRPDLENNMAARQVFVSRPNLFSNTTAQTVPAPGQITSTINVPVTISITGVKVFLALKARTIPDGANDTRAADTVVTLRSPGGTTVTLHDRGRTLAPDGLFEWYSPFETQLPAGQSFANLNGQQGQGTWTLTVQDVGSGVAGRLDKWKLDLAGTVAGPDLSVTSLAAPDVGVAGGTVPIIATIRNGGNAAAGAFAVRYVLSTDTTINVTDTSLGDENVSGLAAATSVAVTRTALLPGGLAAGTYFIGAIADFANTVGEVNEANNISLNPVSIQVNAAGANIAVTTVTLPATGNLGATLPVSVVLSNTGSATITSTFTSRIFLTASGTIDGSAVQIDSFDRAGLLPNASVTVNRNPIVPVTIAPGNYTVCVQADATSVVAETSETDNTLCNGPVALISPGSGTDLVVSAVSAAAAGAAGLTLPVTVTVQNVGGTASGASTTEFFLSTGTNVSTGAASLGTFAVPALAPGATFTVTRTATIPAATAAGTYFVVARADSAGAVVEASETNNERASQPVTIGAAGPDLTVLSVNAPATGTAGAAYPVEALVRNAGTVDAGTFETRFYLSADSTITTGDREIGVATTLGLAPGASVTVTNPSPIPAAVPAGQYFAGAIVNPTGAVTETDATNNARASAATVVISGGQAAADLAVTAVSAPANAAVGGSISVTVTIANVGSAPINTLFINRVFLSTDATITTGDLFLGDVQQSQLDVNESRDLSASFAIPGGLAAGNYFVGVIGDVDGRLTDASRANNIRASTTTVAIAAGGLPDLIPFDAIVPAQSRAGSTVVVEEIVENRGAAAAPAGWATRWFLSTDTVFDNNDPVLGTFVQPTLQAASRAAVTRQLQLPANLATGSYRFGLIVDVEGRIVESNEVNNLGFSIPVSVTAIGTGADLAIPDPPAVTPVQTSAGGFGSISFRVRNLGSSSANGPFSVGVYLLPTPQISASGFFLGSVTVPTLGPGATSASVTAPFQIPPVVQRGAYFIGVVADITSLVPDINRANNASPGVGIVVEDPQFVFDVVALSADGPLSAARGSTQTFTARVANNGARPITNGFNTAFNLRSGATGAVTLGRVRTAFLGAFQSTQVSLTAQIPASLPDNAYFLESFADVDDQVRPELSEVNNVFVRPQTLAVVSPVNVPNLTVTTFNVSPSTAIAGQPVFLTARIQNVGTGSTQNGFTSQVFLSRDATITTTDTLLDTFSVPAVNGGAETFVSRTVPLPPSLLPGSFFIGLIANSPTTISESSIADNSAAQPLSIVQGPDLVVQSVTFAPASLNPGEGLVFNTTVRNQGPAAVRPPPTRLINRFFLGRASPVTASDILLGIESVPIDAGIAVNGSVASVTTLAVPANTPPGQYFIGVLTDATNGVFEQREDNNLFTTVGRVTVLGGAQLEADSTSAPDVITGDVETPVAVAIRNTGSFALNQSVEVAFSLVQVAAPFAAFPLQTVTVASQGLSPGQVRTFSPTVRVSPSVPPGFYRLQARLDPANAVPEPDESDATHVVLATAVTQLVQPGAVGATVQVFRDPSDDVVGPVRMRITADFSTEVSQPSIAIDTPGTNRLPLTPMGGSGATWTIDYQVPRDNASFDRDGLYTIRVEGALDANGVPNAPPTAGTTFTADTRGPVITLSNLKSGDVVGEAPEIRGRVNDARGAHVVVRIAGSAGTSETVELDTLPPGDFVIPSGDLAVTDPTSVLTFTGTDDAGNAGPALSVAVALDADLDGMTDAFETANGLDRFDASDAAAQAVGYPAGFTNLDVFRLGLSLARPPAGDPRLVVPAAAVPPNSAVAPGVLRPVATVTSPGTGAGPVTFAWRQVAGPEGTLLNASTASPAFVARTVGQYRFEVVVANAAGHAAPLVQTFDVVNAPPKAVLREGGAVLVGQDVLLDAGGSTDLNDQPLTFTWRADPANPAATNRFTTGPRASFTPNAPGTFRYFVKARDELGVESAEAPAEFQASDPLTNRFAPTADAGLDQVVSSGVAVTLDGSVSAPGVPGAGLSYSWTQIGGAAVSLVSPNTVRPVFQATTAGTREFALVVTNDSADRLQSARDTVRVVVAPRPPAPQPTAVAGPDQRRVVGDLVQLDGAASVAASAGALVYTWTQAAGPALSAPLAAVAQPAFSPALPGDYLIQLIVDEGGVTSPPDTVLVRVLASAAEQPPVANPTLAGQPLRQPAYRVRLPSGGGVPVSLDGSASFDPQNRPIAYRWSQLEGPDVQLSSVEVASPAFTARLPGVHVFELVVDNGSSRGTERLVLLVDPSDRQIPTAAIAPLAGDQATTAGPVTLAGSASTPGTAFQWVQTAGPLVPLAGANTEAPTFTPLLPGTYSFELHAIDGALRSPAAAYTFQVVPAAATPGAPGTPEPPGGNPLPSPGNDTGGGGGGGCHAGRDGAADPLVALLFVLPLAWALRRRAAR